MYLGSCAYGAVCFCHAGGGGSGLLRTSLLKRYLASPGCIWGSRENSSGLSTCGGGVAVVGSGAVGRDDSVEESGR